MNLKKALLKMSLPEWAREYPVIVKACEDTDFLAEVQSVKEEETTKARQLVYRAIKAQRR